jgi:hypothetical protein
VTHKIPSHGKKVFGKKCAGVSSNGSGTLSKLAPILASTLCISIFQQLYFPIQPWLCSSLFETESTECHGAGPALWQKGQPILRYFKYFKSCLFSFF